MRLTRYRLRALARPARRWLVGLALAAVTFALVHRTVARAEAAWAAWGTSRSVLIARRDLQPGDRIDRSTVRLQQRPQALVADDALDGQALDDPPTLATPALAGEPIRRAQLNGPGRRVPAGRRGMAVPRPAGLALAPGDRVDVVEGVQGSVAARAATVLWTAGDAVVLGVSADEVAAVARAAATGRALVVLTGDD